MHTCRNILLFIIIDKFVDNYRQICRQLSTLLSITIDSRIYPASVNLFADEFFQDYPVEEFVFAVFRQGEFFAVDKDTTSADQFDMGGVDKE